MKKNRTLFVPSLCLSLLLFLNLASCRNQTIVESSNPLLIMTYNVENLFDNSDDPNKEDETYLPMELKQNENHKRKCKKLKNYYYKNQCLNEDWSNKKIDEKLKRIADVILQVKNGKGPDVLVLTEVENINILEKLRLNHLQNADYKKSILIEGPDERGIDVAILSRLPIIKDPQLHLIDLNSVARNVESHSDLKKVRAKKNKKEFKKKKPRKFDGKVRPTRGILQAQFQLPDEKRLTVFACHFPSQGSPTSYRKKAIETLNHLKSTLPADEFVLAAGDFNITIKEDLKNHLIKKDLGEKWLISHVIGCESCKGTHNYRGEWSFLDLILFSKNFETGSWQINKKSIQVADKSIYQLSPSGEPERFNDGKNKKGVSDHLPLIVEIFLGDKK